MTEVMLGWACGSLKAINTGPEYKATVSAAEKNRETEIYPTAL